MAQMKEQNKTPEKEQKEMEISSLPDAEFKTLVVRMIKELIGYFNSVKETQAEMKVTLSEIKENVQEVNSGFSTLGHATKGVIAALPNTKKQTQGGCQNQETKKYGPNERTGQNSRKKSLHEMEIRNLSDAEFKILVIWMLK